MNKLSIELLGTFHIKSNSEPIPGFATDKARALLAYLVIERARPQRREALAALLWPDQSDEHARQSLRQALSHLKQALGSDEFILASPQDIQLHPQANIWSDAIELEDLVQACASHRHHDVPHCLPCIQRQERIAQLHSGDFLKGFPSQNSDNFEEWLSLTRERLRQAAMNAHINLAQRDELRGDLDSALAHSLAQIQLEPWREEAHRQAMRLYARRGERSKALAQYQVCRRILQDELGAEPTRETASLLELIQSETLPAPSAAPLPPEPPGAFVGRAREMKDLSETLADPACRLLTILGMGGVGKSRLAVHLARAHAGLYRDGIHYIPLAAAQHPLGAIAQALGQTSPDAAEHLPDILRGQEHLLVLDNFEHLVESAESLSALLEAAPATKIVVTSRERLRLREEWVYNLDGLSYPHIKPGHQEWDNEQNARQFDALALFEIRAAQVDSRFRLTPTCLADAIAICQLVEGHPLAIELAACAASERSCADLLASLRQTFDALETTLRNFPARHRSLRAVFEHSWNSLTAEEQTKLAELSVFAGGFSLEAARQAVGATPARLANLVAKSLLRHETDDRYNLHESIRQFAAEKLTITTTTKQRHAEYFASYVTRFGNALTPQALALLEQERANLRAAWEWSFEHDARLAISLLEGLALLYTLRGPLTEAENLFSSALASLDGDIHKSQIKNNLALELARIYNAQARHNEAIELTRAIHEPPLTRARARLLEGQAFSAQGECEFARPPLNEALQLAQALGERRIEADSLRELGNVANRLADYDLAIPLYQQSLALARDMGDLRGESATLNNWASVEWDLGDLPAAQQHYEQALALYRALGNRLGEAKALNNLSNVAADQGDMPQSLAFCQQALAIHREMGNRRGQSAALNNLGATYFALNQYDDARKHYLQALALYRESNNRQAEAETLANLSLLACVQGQLESGRLYAHQAIELAGQVGDKVNQANACYYLGRIELADGQTGQAEQALNQALALRQDVPHPGRIAEIQAELALAAWQRGDTALARERMAPVLQALETLDGADQPERIRALAAEIGR